MKKSISLILILVLSFSLLSFNSSADVYSRDDYYNTILESIIAEDGMHDPSEYKLVDLDSSENINTFSNTDHENIPDAVQVIKEENGEVCMETFIPYVYDSDGNFVNAFAAAYDREMIPEHEVFDGATIKSRAKYKYMSYRGNYFFYPREFGVTWLGGGELPDVEAQFFARGPLYNQNKLDDLDHPDNWNYTVNLHVYQSFPQINVEYTRTTEPYDQVIGVLDFLTDGGFISIKANGSEAQITVIDKGGPKL